MRVKIVAIGHSPPVWKNVFHHLRGVLPGHPFAAGIFSTTDEMDYLTGSFFPHQWRREEVDLVICEGGGGHDWRRRLDFLKRVSAQQDTPPVRQALTLASLEGGLRQLIQGRLPVEIQTGHKNRFRVSDPAFITRGFPEDFPRLRVNEYVTGLRMERRKGQVEDVSPHNLAPGTLVGFSELETLVHQGEALEPEDWLRKVLKLNKLRLPPGTCPGLIQEGKSLYLFPGIPAGRVQAISVDGVVFQHLLDLGQLNGNAPQYNAMVETLREMAARHQERHAQAVRRNRLGMDRRELPLMAVGGPEVVRNTLAERLARLGYARATAQSTLGEGDLREPTLLLLTGQVDPALFSLQLEEPVAVSLTNKIDPKLKPLEGFMPDWHEVPYQPPAEDGAGPRPGGGNLKRAAEELSSRARKAAEGLKRADSQSHLLGQESTVLEAALQRLQELLAGPKAPALWSGNLPASTRAVVIFAHDPEEAGAALQSLGHIQRRRWFDLRPHHNPEAMRVLDLGHLEPYLEDGSWVITSTSREKLRQFEQEMRTGLEDARRGTEEAGAARRFYEGEDARGLEARQNLVRDWVRESTDKVLRENEDALSEMLDLVRRRSERRWLSRALVNRVCIVASDAANLEALAAACREVYPSVNLEHSLILPYHYAPLDALPADERRLLAPPGTELSPGELGARVADALERTNRIQRQAYFDLVGGAIEQHRVDLLLIEQHSETAIALLEYLRGANPALEQVPAVLVLPNYWAVEPGRALPWPRTRLVLWRRMGAVTAEEAANQLEALYEG